MLTDRAHTEDELDAEAVAGAWQDDDEIRLAYSSKLIKLRIYRSELLLGYSGLGIYSIYDPSARTTPPEYILDLELKGDTTVAEVRKKIANTIGFEGDPACCQLYRYDALSGIKSRAGVRLSDLVMLASEKVESAEMQYWLHMVPEPVNKHEAISTDESPSEAADPRSSEEGQSVHPSRESDGSGERNGHENSNTSSDAQMADASEAGVVGRSGEPDRSGNDMDVERTPTIESILRLQRVGRPATMSEHANGRSITPHSSHSTLDMVLKQSILIFVKRFDVDSQRLVGEGSCMVRKSDIVGQRIRDMLGLPSSRTIRVSQETHIPTTARRLDPEQTFREESIHDGAILIFRDAFSESR